jgi:N-acetylneuraminic acid mutarotase
MGIGPGKTWKDVSNAAYELDTATGKWKELHPVPGTAGRLGAAAIGARGQAYIFGGYVLDGQGGETTLRDVNVYLPEHQRWFHGEDIPVPVDDTVIGVHSDRYIYLISGWSKTDAVNNVQVYDAEKNTWAQATPIPGRPVFGHAGSLVGDTIIFIDGAYRNPSGSQPRYLASDQCWMGKVDHHDPTKIQWSKIEPHPGTARYRIAAGASERDQKIYFSGGTSNPYNYNGIGYDGQPSQPSAVTFAWDVKSGKWETLDDDTPRATMDNRGLAAIHEGLVVAGGMDKEQKVTAQVSLLSRAAKTAK